MARTTLPLVLATVATTLFAAPVAEAQRRIVIENFRGPAGATVRSNAVRGLRDVGEVAVVARRDVDRTARRLRVRMSRERDYVRVARALDVDAFVVGRVVRRRGWRATVAVLDGETGRVTSRTTFRARSPGGLSRAMRESFWPRLRGSIVAGGERTHAAAPAADADMTFGMDEAADAEAPPEHEPLSARDPDAELAEMRSDALDPELFAVDDELPPALAPSAPFEAEHSPGEARVSFRLFNRAYRYRDDLGGTTVPYDLPLGPSIGLGGDWYPGAHFDNGFLAHIGVTVDASHSLFLASAGPNGVTFPTKETYWSFGLRGRIPVGTGEIGLVAAFGQHGFSVEASHPSDGSPDIASARYTHLRLGADARIPLGAVSIRLSAAWLAVTGVGEVADLAWYPGASAQGVSASAGLGYDLGLGFEARLEANTALYFLDFHPSPDDPEAVGGATDRYIGGTLGLAWRIPPTAF